MFTRIEVILLTALFMLCIFAATSQAALIDNGKGMVVGPICMDCNYTDNAEQYLALEKKTK
jgi:hypothetical protein